MTGPASMEFASMTRFAPSASAWRRARTGRGLLSAAVLLALLAGCTTHMHAARIDRHVIVGSVPEDYRTTHPIAIEEGIETLDVPAGLNTVRLTTGAKEIIAGFAQAFLASGSATIAVVTPTASTNQAVARELAGEIRDELVAAGVDAKAIEFRVYPAHASEVTAPIRLAYSKIGAHTAGCGPWPDQVTRNIENRNYANYGCATQQNLAAMVSNPLDLLYPRGMTPPDAVRRVGVVGNYEGNPDFAGYQPKPTHGIYPTTPDIAKGVGD
jgi:pilus assembly protein CpaD